MTDFNGTLGHRVTAAEAIAKPWLHLHVGFDFRDVFESHANTNSDDFYDLGAGRDRVVAGSGVDHIWAGTRADTIFAGAGDDFMFAWNRDESPTTAAWGQDEVHGGAGNDFIDYSLSTSDVTVYGDDARFIDASTGAPGSDVITTGSGNDYIEGGGGFRDFISSGAGKDDVFGGDGIDIIDGGSGNDRLHGDAGDDQITGGLGADQLWGGSGADKFIVNSSSESGGNWINADVIHDFNASTNSHSVWDTIDLVGHGTKESFGSLTMNFDNDETWEQSFVRAKGNAEVNFQEVPGHKYVFVTDHEDGWLFADTNGDHKIDTAIELRDVTDFHWQNIV